MTGLAMLPVCSRGIMSGPPPSPMFHRLAPVLSLVAIAPLMQAANGDLTTLVNNGSSANRVDIVYMGDGYTADQQATYATQVNQMNSAMFDAGYFSWKVDPFPRYAKFFNVHRIEVVSAQSGADDPSTNTYVNTALGATYAYQGGSQRTLYINETEANKLLPHNTGKGFVADIRMVTVNASSYGGAAINYAVYSAGYFAATEIAMHEMGHSFGKLEDEYGGIASAFPGAEPDRVNVTKDPTGAKWQRWMGYNDPRTGVVGVYEGGDGYNTGIYHPSADSKMNNLNKAFDPIAKEQFISRIYDFVRPIDAHLDNLGTLTDPTKLWVKSVDAQLFTFEWFVDGTLIAGATGEEFDPSLFGLSAGLHTIKAKVSDLTDMVRDAAILAKMTQEVSWTVNLVAVPEPAAYAGASLAFSALCLIRRRKRARA